METIKPQTIYTEVDKENNGELPFIIFSPFGGGEAWLEKKEDQIVLSREELLKVVGDAFRSGVNRALYQGHPSQEQYLDNLINSQ